MAWNKAVAKVAKTFGTSGFCLATELLFTSFVTEKYLNRAIQGYWETSPPAVRLK
jgi:hypothetical protein